MPASNSRLPNLEDLKNFDPKRFAVDHGEKVALAVCVLLVTVGLVGLIGELTAGGQAGRELERETDALKKAFGNPAKELDHPSLIGKLGVWKESLPDSDAWDTWAARMVEGRVAMGTGRVPEYLKQYADRAPDVRGTVHLRDLHVDHGYGWILQGARVNRKDLNQWKQGLLRRDAIRVADVSVDKQWAVVTAWFDLRDLVNDSDGLLRGLGGVFALLEVEARMREAGKRDERERGGRGMEGPGGRGMEGPGGRGMEGPGGRGMEDPAGRGREMMGEEGLRGGRETTLWMPKFRGFEVLREDLARPGVWEPVEVPPPVLPEVRGHQLPRPGDWPLGRPWPPKRRNPWEGGVAGINSVVRRDPYPALPGRVQTTEAPAFFQTQRGRLPGGIYFHSDPTVLAETIEGLMTDYLNAKRSLDRADETGAAGGRAALLREKAIWNRTVQREHGMGVRFVDTTVQPGHRYRYRLRLLIENPCVRLTEVYASAEARKDKILRSDFSAPSPVIDIPRMVEFYLQMVGAAQPEKAAVEVHALYRGVWRVVRTRVWVGERIAYTGPLKVVKKVRRIDPADVRPARGGEDRERREREDRERREREDRERREREDRERREREDWERGERGDRERGDQEPREEGPGLEQRVVSETVTLDSGAVLLDLVPAEILQSVPAKRGVVDADGRPVRDAAGKPKLVRNFLAPPTFLRVERYRMVFLDAAGVVGVVLQGDISERAKRRREDYEDWLRGGLKDLEEPERRRSRRPRPFERGRRVGPFEGEGPPDERGEWRREEGYDD